jgi:PAS domain S-box-containing protein
MSGSADATTAELRRRLAEMEEALRAAAGGVEPPHRIPVERMPEAALTLMPDGEIVHANRRFAELAGVAPERLPGRALRSLVPEAQRPIVDGLLSRAAEGARGELALRRDDGEETTVLLSVGSLPADGSAAIAGIVVDLAEARRRETPVPERFARAVLDQATEAMLVCDAQGRIGHAGRAATALAGRDPTGLLLVEAFRFGPGDMATAVGQHVREAVAGAVVQGVEVEIAAAEGRRHFLLSAGPLATCPGSAPCCILTLTEITHRKLAEQRQELLLHELSHRVKNAIAVVSSIASLTLAGDRPLDEARHAFIERLKALGSTQDLLTGTVWQRASLRDLIAVEAGLFGGRVRARGEELLLGAKAAQMLGLALHELGTNAAKHGALSVPEGRVDIVWESAPGEDGPRFRLIWQERDGPPVQAPTRRGFGRLLLERAVPYDVKGTASLDYAPDGLRYTLETGVGQLVAPPDDGAKR